MIEKIQDILKEKYDLATTVKYDMVIGDNGVVKVQIEPPCKNPDCRDEQKKWLLRMAPSVSFDRWSVSAAISERFDSPERVVEYLCYVSLIYRKLFNQLSKDYKDLDDRYLVFEYGEYDK